MADTSLIFDILGRDRASAVMRRVSRNVKTLGSNLDESKRNIRTFGDAMASIGKPTAFLAAAGAAVQLTAAIAPVSGALLALPAAAGVGAAAMVTTKLAAKGMGDVFSAVAEGDAEALSEAMTKIAPAARPAVKAMTGLQKRFKGVQQTVQANVFRGLAPNISKLGNTFLPILRKGLGGVAIELGQLTRGAIATANTPFFQGAVKRTLDATSNSVANLSPAVNGLMMSLGALLKVGAPYIEQLTQWIGLQGRAAGTFLSSAQGMEFLRQKLEQGKTALLTLISITGNVRSALSGIFQAAGAENLLATMDRLTAKFATWANSVRGQQKLTQLFTSLTTVATALITAFTQMAGPLGMIANLFLSLPAPLQKLIASSLAWSLLIGKLVSVFSPLLAALRFLPGILRAIGLAFRFMLGPWGIAITLAALLATVIIKNWDKIKAATIAVWNAVKNAIVTAWNFIKNIVMSAVSAVVGFLRSAWNRARNLVSSAWNAISNAVSNGVSAMMGFVRSIPGRIVSALGNLGSLLVGAGRSIIEGLWNGIRAMGSWLAGQIMGFIRSFVPGPVLRFLGIGSPSKLFASLGREIPAGLAQGILGGSRQVAGAAQRMASATVPDFPGGMAGAAGGLAGAGGRRDRPVQLEIRSGGSDLDELITELLRRVVRIQGGDVQEVLGG